MSLSAEAKAKPLPNAKEILQKLAMREAEKASEEARLRAVAHAEKEALLEKLRKPSGVSDEEALRRVNNIIERAVGSGLLEVLVYRFPNELCTDRGRAIIQGEAGWEKTLTGLPKEMYEFWDRQLRSLGYKLRFEVIEWPGGMPGDIGVTLRWG